MNGTVLALIEIVKHSLSIYDTKQSREYLDRVIFLEKVMYEESNKGDSQNRARFDNARNELCIIANNVAKFGKPVASN